jgi:hypothetical protein
MGHTVDVGLFTRSSAESKAPAQRVMQSRSHILFVSALAALLLIWMKDLFLGELPLTETATKEAVLGNAKVSVTAQQDAADNIRSFNLTIENESPFIMKNPYILCMELDARGHVIRSIYRTVEARLPGHTIRQLPNFNFGHAPPNLSKFDCAIIDLDNNKIPPQPPG